MSSSTLNQGAFRHWVPPAALAAQAQAQAQLAEQHGHSQQTVSPQDTQHRPTPTHTPGPSTNASTSAATINAAPTQPTPIVATGEWQKGLVQLAKTAELKKHGLTLQLHTAHILSAHASLEQKTRAIEDLREQRNKLDSERKRLIECLSQVNEDRNTADLLESSLNRECTALRTKIATLSADGSEYAEAKKDVDRLRRDLGQPPVPGLQQTLEERGAGYLAERRVAGSGTTSAAPTTTPSLAVATPALSSTSPSAVSIGGVGGVNSSASVAAMLANVERNKRKRDDESIVHLNASTSSSAIPPPVAPLPTSSPHPSPAHGVYTQELMDQLASQPVKRPRGRPKGSKNKVQG